MTVLKGKTALVTGAGSGIGLASCVTLAAAGARVYVNDVDSGAAGRTAQLISSQGGEAVSAPGDASSVDALAELFGLIDRHEGGLDILFNNVGAPGPAGLDVTEDEFDQLVNVNLKSHFFATKFAVPLMIKRGGGSIIYNASVSGLIGSKSGVLYGLTKGGVQLLMRSVARQVGSDGIRANAICPGATRTPLLSNFLDSTRLGLENDELEKQIVARSTTIPLGRLGEPDDVAGVVRFLASPESGYLTGASIPVDGGLLA